MLSKDIPSVGSWETECWALGTMAVMCSGSSYSRLKYWKVLIFSVCHFSLFFPSQASLWSMSPPSSPTPPVLSSERILMQAEVERDMRPEWHWDTVRGMWSPLRLVKHISLVGKSSTFQPLETKASSLPCCFSIPIQALPSSPRALCLSSFHHGGEVSSLHSHFHHISQTSVL